MEAKEKAKELIKIFGHKNAWKVANEVFQVVRNIPIEDNMFRDDLKKSFWLKIMYIIENRERNPF